MKKLVLLLLVICCLFTACRAAQEIPEASDATENQTEVPAETEATEPTEAIPEPTVVPAVVSPLPATIDIDQLDNCTLAVSLQEGDAYVDDTGVMRMEVTVYTYDLYDMVDISNLKEGDTIVIGQQDVTVTSLERNESGAVVINGGLDHGGYELRTDEDGVFYEIGYSDVKSWYAVGEVTLRVSSDFIYTDSSDLDKGDITYYPGDFLVEGTGIDYHFVPGNTSIVIENGSMIAMHRVYMP